MKKNCMFKRLKTDQKAVAGIVVAMLLVGLFISIIAFIQSVYVPQWMKDAEAEHMDSVQDQFTSLKSTIDVLVLNSQKQRPISTNIKMGVKELPFLFSQRSYGSLFLLPNDFSINITLLNGEWYVYNLGSMKYSSSNNYYMQRSYVYENGAVIASQSSGEALLMEPNIYISNGALKFDLIALCGFQNFTSISGYGTYPIKTEFSSNDNLKSFNNVENISIKTSHAKTWISFIQDTLGSSFQDILETTEGVELIPDPSVFSSVDVEVYYIKTKITPGWTV